MCYKVEISHCLWLCSQYVQIPNRRTGGLWSVPGTTMGVNPIISSWASAFNINVISLDTNIEKTDGWVSSVRDQQPTLNRCDICNKAAPHLMTACVFYAHPLHYRTCSYTQEEKNHYFRLIQFFPHNRPRSGGAKGPPTQRHHTPFTVTIGIPQKTTNTANGA